MGRMPDETLEPNLAVAVHEGEQGALERLVCEYQDSLYGYVFRLVRNAFDADEIVQDAFIRAHNALAWKYDLLKCRSLALRPWLFRIARNLALNRLRAASRVRSATELRGEIPAEVSFDNRHDSEHGQLLEQALALLENDARELIVLRFFEELPYAEIAGIVGRSAAAVRGAVFRALRILRKSLEKMGYLNAL